MSDRLTLFSIHSDDMIHNFSLAVANLGSVIKEHEDVIKITDANLIKRRLITFSYMLVALRSLDSN